MLLIWDYCLFMGFNIEIIASKLLGHISPAICMQIRYTFRNEFTFYLGKHDGEYNGKRYFQCEKWNGLFIKRNKLCKDVESSVQKLKRCRK